MRAETSSYVVFCEYLNLDSDKLTFVLILLQPWQVTGTAWMTKQEQGFIGGGILGDECGLEKIIQALMLIEMAAREAVTSFYAILVLASSQLVNTWVQEIHQKFGKTFSLLLFYRTLSAGSITDSVLRQYVVNPKEIIIRALKLDSNDPKTVRIIVLSSYGT